MERVDWRDVAAATGMRGTPDPHDAGWQRAAEDYVDANPRPAGFAADAQRLQILRVLAAGPATTAELLAAMRVVGWVGASDLENRLRDLRGKRGGGRTVALRIEVDGDVHRLLDPLPALTEAQLRAVGFVKSVVATQPGPLAAQGLQALDGVLPGVGAHGERPPAGAKPMSAEAMHRFEAARVGRHPVDVTYYSMNSAREKTYRLVPVEYVPVGPALKAVCIEVDAAGRPGAERQFALDRIRSVAATELPALAPEDIVLRREVLDIEVTDPLYRIMRDRDQYGIAASGGEQLDVDRWRVRGEFPVVLGWDVMEQMSAWAGSVIVHEPLWLVNAVMRRLRAGLRAMEDGEMELVKPDPDRPFASLQEAITSDAPAEALPAGPRKLAPGDR